MPKPTKEFDEPDMVVVRFFEGRKQTQEQTLRDELDMFWHFGPEIVESEFNRSEKEREFTIIGADGFAQAFIDEHRVKARVDVTDMG